MSQNTVFLIVLAVGVFFLFKDQITEWVKSLYNKATKLSPVSNSDQGMMRFMQLRTTLREYENIDAKDVVKKLNEAVELAVKTDLLNNDS
jgi:hypothetical protein